MSDTFTITEKPELGGFTPRSGKPAIFQWTAGNRNMPQNSWEFGGRLRTNRIDYPGADRPTEQVLGANYTPFTLVGRWSNKFNQTVPLEQRQNNVGNYAEEEMTKFENMCRRGNIVEIEFQGIKIQGLITEWKFTYRRRWDIGYSFTVSPHRRPDRSEIENATQNREVVRSPKELSDEVNNNVKEYLKEHQTAGQLNSSDTSAIFGKQSEDIKGTIVLTDEEAKNVFGRQPRFNAVPFEVLQTANEQISEVSKEAVALGDIVDQRVLALEAETALSLSAAIGRTDLVIQKAYNMTTVAGPLKSAATLLYRNPIDDLNFDIWNKGRGVFGRKMVVSTNETRTELLRRQKPDAIALYRPFEGETLYSIAQRFYQDFQSWRLIYERNGLDYTTMKGDELLIIPEASKK